MNSKLFLLAFLLCAFASLREVSAAQLIRDGKLQTDLNANTNRITNATDVVTASGVSLTNLASNLGGGTGTLYRIQSQVSGLGFTTPNGPTAFLTGTVATAGSFADTNSVGVISSNSVNQSTNVAARLASNVWAVADSTTNYYQSISLGGGYNWSIEITNKGGAYYLNDTNRSLSRYEGGVVTGPMTNIFSITSGRLGGGNAWNGLLRMWWDAEPAYVELSPNAGGTYPLGLSLDGGAQHPIWSSYYQGAGTGMDSDLLDGLNSSAFFQSIATNGSGNVVTNLTFGGSVITQQMGTVTGGSGSIGNQRSFEWRDAEGSANVGWTKTLAAGVNLVSVRTATNDLTFAAYGTTASTTLQTNTLYCVFEHSITGSISWLIKSSQSVAGGLVILTPKDGQTAGAAITQELNAASTLWQTNQPLSITAKTATVEVRIMTTNSANLFQLGVDVQ